MGLKIGKLYEGAFEKLLGVLKVESIEESLKDFCQFTPPFQDLLESTTFWI